MSTAAQDFITEAKEQYWYDMFIKVTGYWYGNETPNMDKEEFIATRIRRAPAKIEREKGKTEWDNIDDSALNRPFPGLPDPQREDGFLKALDEKIESDKREAKKYNIDTSKGVLFGFNDGLEYARDLYLSTLTKK